MPTSKILIDGVGIDLTSDTVDAAHLQNGYTAHDSTGAAITGTLHPGVTPTGNINITSTQQTDVTNYATAQIVDANLTAANIAKDVVVLGITGTHEGGGGGTQPQLNAPTIAISGDTLSVTDPSANGNFTSSFAPYESGVYMEIDLPKSGNPTTVDLTTLGLPSGDYSFQAACKGTNFTESAKSNAVSYSNIFYSITNALTHCSSNNAAAQVRKGSAYTATITADTGYSVSASNVTVTMGGAAVTGAYSGGVITIANVTGALSITVTATLNTVITAGTYVPINSGTYTYEDGHTDISIPLTSVKWTGSTETAYAPLTFKFAATSPSTQYPYAYGWCTKTTAAAQTYFNVTYGYSSQSAEERTITLKATNLKNIVITRDTTLSLENYNFFCKFWQKSA